MDRRPPSPQSPARTRASSAVSSTALEVDLVGAAQPLLSSLSKQTSSPASKGLKINTVAVAGKDGRVIPLSSITNSTNTTSAGVITVAGGLTPPLTPVTAEKTSSTDTTDTKPDLKPPAGTYTLSPGLTYGLGAWASVHPGTLHLSPKTTLPIAVKTPRFQSSHAYLRSEARILSLLPPHENLIPFYGFNLDEGQLLLEAVPLTLERFIEESLGALNERQNGAGGGRGVSMKNARCPVIGMRQWLFLATKLFSILQHLSDHGVIHSDIKPSNILLRPYTPTSQTEISIWGPEELLSPYLADFSSSFLVQDGPSPDLELALTTHFCAPELLTTLRLPPTHSTDLYATSLTLLTAAIGSSPYTGHGGADRSTDSIMTMMWAKEGRPLAFARVDERGLRCRKGGVVGGVLEGCFGRGEGRVGVDVVRERVRGWVERWKEEGRGDLGWGC